MIEGVLPTYYAASGLTIADLAISLTIFLVLYTCLLYTSLLYLKKLLFTSLNHITP